MDCTLETPDIAGDSGFFSIGDYVTRTPDMLYETLSTVVEHAQDFFNLTKDTAGNVLGALEVSAASFGIVTTIGDTLGMVNSAKACAEAAEEGVFSGDFLSGLKDVAHDFGDVVMGIYSSTVFLTSLKVMKAVSPAFKMFALTASLGSVFIDIYNSCVVISKGTVARPAISQVKKDLIERNYQKHEYKIAGKLVSLTGAVVGLSGMVFCPAGALALAFVSLGASFGEFYHGREMLTITTDAALKIK